MGRLCRFGEGDNLWTCSLPLEDQEWRINEHNIRKLLRNLGDIQGGCPPSLTIKGSQATQRLKCTQSMFYLESKWTWSLFSRDLLVAALEDK